MFSALFLLQVVLGVTEECLIESDIRNYSYLTNGYVPIVMGEDDVELYRQVLEAMDVLGFTKDEQIGLLHGLCHVLQPKLILVKFIGVMYNVYRLCIPCALLLVQSTWCRSCTYW